jgi:hypothetical protein
MKKSSLLLILLLILFFFASSCSIPDPDSEPYRFYKWRGLIGIGLILLLLVTIVGVFRFGFKFTLALTHLSSNLFLLVIKFADHLCGKYISLIISRLIILIAIFSCMIIVAITFYRLDIILILSGLGCKMIFGVYIIQPHWQLGPGQSVSDFFTEDLIIEDNPYWNRLGGLGCILYILSFYVQTAGIFLFYFFLLRSFI